MSIHVAATHQTTDTQITNTDGRALCHTCVTRWVGRGGVGMTCFFNIHERLTTPATYKRSKPYVFEKNIVMFRPNLHLLIEGPEGFPVKTKIKADTKRTFVMCCQIFDKRSTAPFSGRFRRRPAPPQAC